MSKNLIENIAFKLQCKECEYHIESGDQSTIESLVSISQHIETTGHEKYELEIYDFDLAFVKETIDIIKLFEDIDDSLNLSDMVSKLKNMEYKNTGVIIKNAIQDDILCVDDIEDNDIYFSLTDLGEDIWETCKRENRIKK